MSSRDVVKITLEVKDIDEVDFLEVVFESERQSLKWINLNDETLCQADPKEVFHQISQLMVANDLKIEFVESEGHPRELIYEAMKVYVANLEKEVATVAELMKKEISDADQVL